MWFLEKNSLVRQKLLNDHRTLQTVAKQKLTMGNLMTKTRINLIDSIQIFVYIEYRRTDGRWLWL